MSNNTSQRTEEEMLDQTFQGYDQEMTVDTESPETVENTKPSTEKKKDSSTKYIVGAGVVAFVVVLGWLVLGGKSAPQQPNNTNNNAQNNQTANNNVAPTNVAPTPTPVVAPTQPVQNNTLNNVTQPNNVKPVQADPNNNFLAGQGNAINSLANPNNTPVAAPNDVTPTPVVTTPINGNTPVTPINAPVITPDVNPNAVISPNPAVVGATTGNNVVQQALVDQLKMMFEQQTKEIKSSVEQVGNRVSDIEKDLASQKEATKSIEERLAKLEAGKSTKTTVSTNTTTVAVKPKKVYHKPVIVRREATSETTEIINNRNGREARDVLVDKSVDKTPVFSDIQIHSIYAGRAWTKNKDGSLSTFSAGDRLPSGEIIKRIDDEKGQIVTDKRVIK